jgi:hypothetical protein
VTIKEFEYLSGDNPPLPNKVFDLRGVSRMKFFNTSFREYLCVSGDYIIGVYPFSIKLEWSFRSDGNPFTYKYFQMQGVRSSHHHQDFRKGEIDIDPCDIFESVCGVRIHGKESDNHLMNIDHSDIIRLFESEVLSQKRDNKIKNLGI